MKTISYKNYIASIEPDLEEGILVGRVVNTKDIIGFHGRTISETIESFHKVIEEYIEDCKEKGISPHKPYSGRFNLRVPPFLHNEVATAEAKAGKSLNQWVVETLDQAVHSR